MRLSDWISLGSLVMAVVAVVYTYLTNTKKYELTSQYRKELLMWYSNIIEILMRIKTEIQYEEQNPSLKYELLSKLSSQIEIGRFYFPNIANGDNFGAEKLSAYRGRRNLILDFLVYYYEISLEQEAKKYIQHLEILQRQFTSHIFEILNPRKFLKDTQKYTNNNFNKELSVQDLIKQNPEKISEFFYGN